MAEITLFHYEPGHSYMHRLDVRFKLGCLAVISASLVGAGTGQMIGLSTLTALALVGSRTCIGKLLRDLAYAVPLLVLVVGARALAGLEQSEAEAGQWAASAAGLRAGGLIAWRLSIVLVLGSIVAATTRAGTIRDAVEWLLRPVPLIPETRVGIMVGLTARFIPVILDETHGTMDAQKARAVENRKNPVYRAKKLVPPILGRAFTQAGELADAMAARCYSDNRTPAEFRSGSADWITLATVVLFCLFVRLIP
ncbi:energy-coupling factor transporter transmembrane component T family protein [Thermodesulfobacteriota bacterium]